MALPQRVVSLTQDKIVPKVVETLLNSNVFATRMLANAKPWSGEQMKFPVKVTAGVAGTSFSGMDTFSTTTSNRRDTLAYPPKFYEKQIVLPASEIDVNDTDAKVLDLLAIESGTAAMEMADEIGTIFYSTGAGNGNKDFLGLDAIADDATNVTTIGGLSRTTYTSLKGTVTASSGTLSLAKLRTLYNAVASGSVRPTAGFTTEANFGYYEQLLQPMLRINVDSMKRSVNGLRGGDSSFATEFKFTGLDYQGFPILADEKATTNALYFINEDFVEWRAIKAKASNPVNFSFNDIEGTDYTSVKGLGFSWTGWIRPTNAYAYIGHIILGGELVGTNFKRCGQLTGITGI